MFRKLRSLLCAAAAVLLVFGAVGPAQAARSPYPVLRWAAVTTSADRTTAQVEYNVSCTKGRHYTVHQVMVWQGAEGLVGWAEPAPGFDVEYPCGTGGAATAGNQRDPSRTYQAGGAFIEVEVVVCDPDNMVCEWNIELYKDVAVRVLRK